MANFEFKPFDKILVRNCIMGHKAYWIPALYGFKSKDMKHYLTSAGWQEECIPYEGNEEYLGTTKDYVDKVPKFKVGDWICHTVYKKPLLIVEDLGEGDFGTEPKSIITAKEFREGFYRLWTIQDAKDGDLLRIRNLTFIFQEITNNNVCHKDAVVAYCSYQDYDNSFGVCGPDCITDLEVITPAAQKQRDLLFQKMHEAGYEWDAEKKELKKIEQKPAEWSEIEPIIQHLDNLGNTAMADILRSFEPQPKQKWKPSEGQMVALNCAITAASDNFVCLNVKDLESLYEDLKKLTE